MKQIVLSSQVLTTVIVCYLELSLHRIFYLVSSAFSLSSLINLFDVSNSAFSNFHNLEQFSRSLQSFLGSFSHQLSGTFKWGFPMDHTIYFRHSNVNNCIVKTFFGSLFFLFFNIIQATTCSQLRENSV